MTTTTPGSSTKLDPQKHWNQLLVHKSSPYMQRLADDDEDDDSSDSSEAPSKNEVKSTATVTLKKPISRPKLQDAPKRDILAEIRERAKMYKVASKAKADAGRNQMKVNKQSNYVNKSAELSDSSSSSSSSEELESETEEPANADIIKNTTKTRALKSLGTETKSVNTNSIKSRFEKKDTSMDSSDDGMSSSSGQPTKARTTPVPNKATVSPPAAKPTRTAQIAAEEKAAIPVVVEEKVATPAAERKPAVAAPSSSTPLRQQQPPQPAPKAAAVKTYGKYAKKPVIMDKEEKPEQEKIQLRTFKKPLSTSRPQKDESAASRIQLRSVAKHNSANSSTGATTTDDDDDDDDSEHEEMDISRTSTISSRNTASFASPLPPPASEGSPPSASKATARHLKSPSASAQRKAPMKKEESKSESSDFDLDSDSDDESNKGGKEKIAEKKQSNVPARRFERKEPAPVETAKAPLAEKAEPIVPVVDVKSSPRARDLKTLAVETKTVNTNSIKSKFESASPKPVIAIRKPVAAPPTKPAVAAPLKPAVVTPSKPAVVVTPKPEVAASPKPAVVNPPKPVVAPSPKPAVVPSPKPAVVSTPKPVVAASPQQPEVTSPKSATVTPKFQIRKPLEIKSPPLVAKSAPNFALKTVKRPPVVTAPVKSEDSESSDSESDDEKESIKPTIQRQKAEETAKPVPEQKADDGKDNVSNHVTSSVVANKSEGSPNESGNSDEVVDTKKDDKPAENEVVSSTSSSLPHYNRFKPAARADEPRKYSTNGEGKSKFENNNNKPPSFEVPRRNFGAPKQQHTIGSNAAPPPKVAQHDEKEPLDESKPVEENEPFGTRKPVEQGEPVDTKPVVEEVKSVETEHPVKEDKHVDLQEPTKECKPIDPQTPAKEEKAVDPKKPADEEEPFDAKKSAAEDEPFDTKPSVEECAKQLIEEVVKQPEGDTKQPVEDDVKKQLDEDEPFDAKTQVKRDESFEAKTEEDEPFDSKEQNQDDEPFDNKKETIEEEPADLKKPLNMNDQVEVDTQETKKPTDVEKSAETRERLEEAEPTASKSKLGVADETTSSKKLVEEEHNETKSRKEHEPLSTKMPENAAKDEDDDPFDLEMMEGAFKTATKDGGDDPFDLKMTEGASDTAVKDRDDDPFDLKMTEGESETSVRTNLNETKTPDSLAKVETPPSKDDNLSHSNNAAGASSSRSAFEENLSPKEASTVSPATRESRVPESKVYDIGLNDVKKEEKPATCISNGGKSAPTMCYPTATTACNDSDNSMDDLEDESDTSSYSDYTESSETGNSGGEGNDLLGENEDVKEATSLATFEVAVPPATQTRSALATISEGGSEHGPAELQGQPSANKSIGAYLETDKRKKKHRRRRMGGSSSDSTFSVESNTLQLAREFLRKNLAKNNTLQEISIDDLLKELEESEKRQKKLEKQLKQAGVMVAEDIPYEEALQEIERIAKRMKAIGGSDVTHPDKEIQKQLREEYYKLEQEMDKYNNALTMTDEYMKEQEMREKKWQDDNEAANLEALIKLRRHMPVHVRHLSEAVLTEEPSPNGKFLPKPMAKKFKRTNVLQLLRLNPEDIFRMHPSTLENLRVVGLTLTERRALYLHLKDIGPKWQAMQADKITNRKWVWFQMMKLNFRENLESYERHCREYGPPGNHPYATRDNPNVGCPLIGKQCPLKADKIINYDGDYGYTPEAEYEVVGVARADVDDPGAKAMQEALELAKEKKANERNDHLKKHYNGKLLQVAKANGSCELMDEVMDKMESHLAKWLEDVINEAHSTVEEYKKEVNSFTEVLGDLKLSVLQFAERSGMQLSGKKDINADKKDIRSPIEIGLCEEVYETTDEFFKFVEGRMEEIKVHDGKVLSTIIQLRKILKELHERNIETLKENKCNRPARSRRLKTRKDIEKEIKKNQKPEEEVAAPPEAPAETARPANPMMGGRGGLMDAIAGRGGRGGGRGDLLGAIAGRGGGGGRGDLLGAIAGRGRGGGGGRGDLLGAIAGRGRGRGGDDGGRGGGRGDLLAALAGRGRGAPAAAAGGGRGDLLSAIAGRGRGGGGGGGRGDMLAAIAARGGGRGRGGE